MRIHQTTVGIMGVVQLIEKHIIGTAPKIATAQIILVHSSTQPG